MTADNRPVIAPLVRPHVVRCIQRWKQTGEAEVRVHRYEQPVAQLQTMITAALGGQLVFRAIDCRESCVLSKVLRSLEVLQDPRQEGRSLPDVPSPGETACIRSRTERVCCFGKRLFCECGGQWTPVLRRIVQNDHFVDIKYCGCSGNLAGDRSCEL